MVYSRGKTSLHGGQLRHSYGYTTMVEKIISKTLILQTVNRALMDFIAYLCCYIPILMYIIFIFCCGEHRCNFIPQNIFWEILCHIVLYVI